MVSHIKNHLSETAYTFCLPTIRMGFLFIYLNPYYIIGQDIYFVILYPLHLKSLVMAFENSL